MTGMELYDVVVGEVAHGGDYRIEWIASRPLPAQMLTLDTLLDTAKTVTVRSLLQVDITKREDGRFKMIVRSPIPPFQTEQTIDRHDVVNYLAGCTDPTLQTTRITVT